MLTSAPRHAMDLSVVAPSKFYDGSRKMNSVNIDSGYTYKYTVRWAFTLYCWTLTKFNYVFMNFEYIFSINE